MGKIVRRGVQNGWVWWSVRIFTRLLVGHMCQHMGKPVPTPVGEWGRRGEDKNAVNICLVGYNICNGRNGGLESALNAMVQANMDLRVLFKTNITGGVKMCRSSGYSVVASEVPIKHQGGESILF